MSINSSKSIEYEDRYVCFLDLLGFSRLVSSGDSEVARRIGEELLSQFPKIRQSALEQVVRVFDEPAPRANVLRVSFFSDCLVISADPDDTGFWRIHHACVQLTDGLLRAGQLLRGALTFGPIYHDPGSSVVFGPAQIDAYHLECSIAMYPRIIVSSAACQRIRRVCDDRFDDSFNEVIDTDSDGQQYLPVFEHGFIQMQSRGRDFYKLELRNLLIREMKRHRADDRIILKIKWAVNEYNKRLVSKHTGFGLPIDIET